MSKLCRIFFLSMTDSTGGCTLLPRALPRELPPGAVYGALPTAVLDPPPVADSLAPPDFLDSEPAALLAVVELFVLAYASFFCCFFTFMRSSWRSSLSISVLICVFSFYSFSM